MESVMLKKQINDFLESEKSGYGKGASKAFKENLAKFIGDVVFEEIKLIKNEIPMKESIPESDASLINKFKHRVGEDVFYVIFTQVRKQLPGKLQVKFGWQFAVLSGKVKEIQIRNDHGIVYNVNGDFVLSDLVFKSEEKAQAKANQLNSGTEPFAISEADEAHIVKCSICGELVDLTDEWFESHPYSLDSKEPIICRSCWELKQDVDGGVVNGDEENGESGNSSDDKEPSEKE